MKFELTGYNIDNLLRTLYIRKVTLFNVERKGNIVSFEILDKDKNKVRRQIANFKVKETLGFYKRLPKIILANVGVLLGVFVGVIFSIFASSFTWQILVYGTKDLTNGEIIKVLNENGVKKGKINFQSSEEIENILLNNYDRIAQVSVIKKGTAIIINLSEKLVYSEGEFQPIIAKYNGIIKSVNIITGTTNVKVGDYVNSGDVLVLPFNINANGEKVSVKPLAEIKAEMFIFGKCEINRVEQALVRTGKTKKVYQYRFNNKNLFYGKNKNSFALFETNVYNENISDLLPLNRDVYVHYELKKVQIEHDFEEEKSQLLEKSKNLACKSLPSGEILNETNETSVIGDTMFACTTITVLGVINDWHFWFNRLRKRFD